MDWDKLRIFHSVAKAGSFTHAGESLNLSQSAISRQISALEESLGTPLFYRHARGLLLTEQGELLQKTASEIFDKLSMIEGEILDSKQLPEGKLRVTIAEFLGSTWLAPRLGDFQQAHPDIQLTILLDDKLYNLGMREADAAIRLYKPEQPDLVRRQISEIGFHICASKDYLERHGTPKDARELRNHTLLGFPPTAQPPYNNPNWLFKIAGVDPDESNNVLLINSLYAIFKAARSGAGIAVLPDYLVDASKTLQKILPDMQREKVAVYFVYPEERRHSKRIALFRDFLLQNLQV